MKDRIAFSDELTGMDLRQYYTKILIDEPANNPPYLTRRGACLILGIIAAAGAGVWLQAVHQNELSTFLVAIAATACLLTAWIFAKLLILWRSLQTGYFKCHAEVDKETLYPGASFRVRLICSNHLPFDVCIQAIRWDCTQNLIVSPTSDLLAIGRSAESKLSFEGKALAIGHATLVGVAIAFSDTAGLFRCETHIEIRHPIDVFPKHPDAAQRKNNELLKALQDKKHSPIMEGDLEVIRPWQNTDSIRRVLWRGFARHLDLQTIERSTHRESSLLCLIDSGAYMRLTRPDKSSNLAQCVEYLADCLPLFENVTIVTYDELFAKNIARNQSPKAAFGALEKWLLETLDWRPPAKSDPNQMEIWGMAATMLYRDYKLYQGVDFMKKSGQEPKIDLFGLVQWAAADEASKLLAQGNEKEAAQYMHTPYKERLVSLIRERCRMPHASLMPNCPVPVLSRALPLLQKSIRSGQANTFIWFSDFAMPMDEPLIRSLSKSLLSSDIASLAVYMPMPRHSLNFNVRRGSLMCNINRQRLGKAFDIVDISHGREKTGTAGVLPVQ